MKSAKPKSTRGSDSQAVEASIRAIGGWRGKTLSEVRRLIRAAVPGVVEEMKWKKPTNPAGVPVWSHPETGIICTGESYKGKVKITFAQGASLPDPTKLFNASLEGNLRRAIDLSEGDTLDGDAFKALVRSTVGDQGADEKPKTKPSSRAKAKPKLLAGGNPQIAKGDGDAPVAAWLAALPAGWKRDLGRRLDDLIVRAAPRGKLRKAVKWNSPFYGVEGNGFFLGMHAFTRYIKLTFFAGTSLRPVPPGGTEKSKAARWIDVHEDDPLDERRLAAWVRQAAALPGWDPSAKRGA
jgi:hypothetical protein